MKAHLESGDVKPLFTSTGREIDRDVPTLKEKGIDLEENKMVGLIAPKGISEEKLNILHEAFKKALEDPELLKEFEKAELGVVYSGPETFQEEISKTFTSDKVILGTAGC